MSHPVLTHQPLQPGKPDRSRSWYHRQAPGRIEWLAILLAAAAEVTAFQLALARFFGDSEIKLWVLTLGFAGASVYANHTLGANLAKRKADGGGYLGWIVASLVAIVTAGTIAFVIRWNSIGVVEESMAGGSGLASASNADKRAQALTDAHMGALVMVAVFVLAGLVAVYAGYRHTAPLAKALDHATFDRDSARTQLRHAQAMHAQAAGTVQVRLADRARNDADRIAMRATVDAWAAELMNLARQIMAERAKTLPQVSGLTLSGPVSAAAAGSLYEPESLLLTEPPGPVSALASDGDESERSAISDSEGDSVADSDVENPDDAGTQSSALHAA